MWALEGHPFAKEFRNSTVEDWATSSGKYAGRTRSAGAGAYTYVEVDAAGHMVPYDQPEAALDMFERCVLRLNRRCIPGRKAEVMPKLEHLLTRA